MFATHVFSSTSTAVDAIQFVQERARATATDRENSFSTFFLMCASVSALSFNEREAYERGKKIQTGSLLVGLLQSLHGSATFVCICLVHGPLNTLCDHFSTKIVSHKVNSMFSLLSLHRTISE